MFSKFMRSLCLGILFLCISGCVSEGPVKKNKSEDGFSELAENTLGPRIIEDLVSVEEILPDVKIQWKVVQSEYRSISDWGSGSLVQINKSIYLFTAYHVVNDPNGKLYIYDSKGSPIRAKFGPMQKYEKGDAAVFKILSISVKVRPYRLGDIDVSKPFQAMGYPKGGDLAEKKGTANRVSVETTCEVISGMSGGGLTQGSIFVGINTDTIIDQNKLIVGGKHTVARDIVEALKLE